MCFHRCPQNPRGRRRVVVALVTWLCYVLQAPFALHLGMLLVNPSLTSGAQYAVGFVFALGFAWWIGLVPALLAVWLSAKSPRFGTAVIVVMPCYLLGVVLALWLRKPVDQVLILLSLPTLIPASILVAATAILSVPDWLVREPMGVILHLAFVVPVILVLLVVYRLTSRQVSDT